MPQWTDEQLEELYDAIYEGVEACPTCGGALDVMRSKESGAYGNVTCRACNARHFVAQGNDPLRSKFRDYSPQESDAIVQAYLSGSIPGCPVDGTTMTGRKNPVIGGVIRVTVECARCSRTAQTRT